MMIAEVNRAPWHPTSMKFLLWDSGSDEHLCRRSFGGDHYMVKTDKKLLGISGVSLGELGAKRVKYKIVGERGEVLNAETEFLVSDSASKDALSVGKMAAQGFAADLRDPKKPFLTHPSLDFMIPLYVHCNSYYLKVLDDEATSWSTSSSSSTGVVVAPVSAQGARYDWEYAGADEEEEL